MPIINPSFPDQAVFEIYLQEYGRSPATIRAYCHSLRACALWYATFRHTLFTPENLTAQDLREYRTYLLSQQAAPATINRVITALKAFVQWDRSVGRIETNPVAHVRGVAEQRHAPRWLTTQEQGRLRREAERQVNGAHTIPAQRQAIRDFAVLLLLLNTGLRVSELCALEMTDIQLTERKGRVIVRQGKGQKQRELPLNHEAITAVKAWLVARPSIHSALLFIGKHGVGLEPRGVQRMITTLGRRADVEVTPHQLRHSLAKNLINAEVGLETVATILGHSNLNTTRIYTTPSQQDLEAALAKVGE